MSKLNELLKEDRMEKVLSEIITRIQDGPERVNMIMNPSLISCNEKEQIITIEFPVLEWQLNQLNILHGGIIATAFDLSLGIFATYLSNKKPVVTVNVSLNYLKPIPADESIRITAKATSLGKKIITMSGECRLKSSGLLTNTALATFAIIG